MALAVAQYMASRRLVSEVRMFHGVSHVLDQLRDQCLVVLEVDDLPQTFTRPKHVMTVVVINDQSASWPGMICVDNLASSDAQAYWAFLCDGTASPEALPTNNLHTLAARADIFRRQTRAGKVIFFFVFFASFNASMEEKPLTIINNTSGAEGCFACSARV